MAADSETMGCSYGCAPIISNHTPFPFLYVAVNSCMHRVTGQHAATDQVVTATASRTIKTIPFVQSLFLSILCANSAWKIHPENLLIWFMPRLRSGQTGIPRTKLKLAPLLTPRWRCLSRHSIGRGLWRGRQWDWAVWKRWEYLRRPDHSPFRSPACGRPREHLYCVVSRRKTS